MTTPFLFIFLIFCLSAQNYGTPIYTCILNQPMYSKSGNMIKAMSKTILPA